MGKIVNLRTERKRRNRAEKDRQAAANRAAFGRSKADRTQQTAETDRADQTHRGRKIERDEDHD